MSNTEKIDWEKMDNLVPVITQEDNTNEVLMLAYMNKEALELTLQTKYAHYFNSAHIRKGHLFQDRYRSYLITNDEYFINAFVYINLNPLEAQLVEQLEDYKWCSYRYFEDKDNAPKCLNFKEIYDLSGIEIARITQFIMSKVSESKKYGREIKEHNSEENIKKIREISAEIQNKYSSIVENRELKYLLVYALCSKKFKLVDISFALKMSYATIRRIKNKVEKRMTSDAMVTEWLSEIGKCFWLPKWSQSAWHFVIILKE